jgi:DNA polymerase-3 subunit alpha
MGKKKLDVMAKERDVFINGQVDEEGNVIVPGCVRNGIDSESANKIFDEMAEFAKYAFNKSHAAAYAVISYRTAFLKAYYQEELMAATLNSFLGNLDKVPLYVDECRSMGIEVLNPSINESATKFTVSHNKIRFGLGSIKNVGLSAIDSIVEERIKNGLYESFTSFCERIKDESVNKKCIESLIKAGAFDELGKNRATLLASYENIVDTISSYNKKGFEDQVSMFDILSENTKVEETMKYTFEEKPEMDKKDLLSYEKEMMGIYISGHPLEKYKELIDKYTNINSLDCLKINDEIQEFGESKTFKDGQNIKFAGIISKVKKKFTKKNTIMAFVTIEDLKGTIEVIVFDSCYERASTSIIEENIVYIDGKLSIREDEETKIVANSIVDFTEENAKNLNDFANRRNYNNSYSNRNDFGYANNENNMNNKDNKKSENYSNTEANTYFENRIKTLSIEISNLSEEQKNKLRGAIRFFSGDRANAKIQITENEISKPCGTLFLTDKILYKFENIVGKENIKVI